MRTDKLKIGVYVLAKHAKQNYKKECYDVRLNAGMAVVCDILRRSGFTNVSYCSSANVHNYDVIMLSITSDCDWWTFIAERAKWQKGAYKVIVGGSGVLNPRPFLEWVDYFVLGRAEGVQSELVSAIADNASYVSDNVIHSVSFSMDKTYYINQTNKLYPYEIYLDNGQIYKEDTIGCNHKCLFCGYTWHRKAVKKTAFNYNGLWGGTADRERAIIDIANGVNVDLVKLRTTAIDGLSERLRLSVKKNITREMLRDFVYRLATCQKPHQVKFYNIVGYPTETYDDWEEFLEDIRLVDDKLQKSDKQTSILLHSTPFRAMPATPMACKSMSYKNYRGLTAKILSKGRYKGNIFYQGNSIWAVESMATESLSTVIQSAIIWRGTEDDADNIVKIALSKKFSAAASKNKQATLEHYFDVDKLFGEFTPDNLPTRNIRTYCKVEQMW